MFPKITVLNSLTTNVTVFGNKTFKRKLRLNGVIRVVPQFNITHFLIRKGRDTRGVRAEKRLCENTTRRWPMQAKERGLRRNKPAGTRILDFQPP